EEDFRKILSENKIPVHVTGRTGYFETIEIQGIVNFLRILDNPLQDIAFFGAMRLPFLDFSEEEIARIRCFAKGQQFLYDQVKYYYEENAGQAEPLQEKLKRLFSMLSDYRKRIVYTPIKDLIRALIEETGYGAYVGSMPGGDQRLANLELLLEKAGTFQNTSLYGLFHFIRYLETIQEQEVDFGEANILDENADVVRIMTIHKSKGLEFPICFVCGLSKQFNMLDMRQAILMDVELGVGVDYIDPEMRIKRRNIRKNVVAQRMKEDTRGEDLRVLYVALTRAKEKLILTGYVDDFDKKLKSALYLTMEEGEKLPYSVIMGAGSYMDLVLASLMRHVCMKTFLEEQGVGFYAQELLYGDVPVQVELCREIFDFREELAAQGKSALLEQELDRADVLANRELKEKIKSRLDFRYPYAYLEGLTVKTTVSELKRESYREELENAAQLIVMKEETYVPNFAKNLDDGADGETQRGGAQYGTAVHKVMELLSFEEAFQYRSEADEKRLYAVIYEERRRWISEGRVTQEELSCVPAGRICTFLKSPLAARMLAAKARGDLYKEQPFVLGVEANQLSGQYPEE
ncbi:MAG: helicase-exonuclease AddAB subunit AddA, partial [Lachnospiraceae bacterium]|nr:helicase-exonuclease AddAB subunit AddA [Lachnospiraceae bacterium]